jgi:2-C-methyl-D-erythritol 4-phosphate cytidylyltransferase
VTTPESAAIVTAAGASARMGSRGKKEYQDLDGVPVLARALLPFLSCGRFSRIIVTIPPGDSVRAAGLLGPHVTLDSVRFVEGGRTRQESVYRALRALAEPAPTFVLIHDGARPWIDTSLIERVLAATEKHGACIPAMEVAEAVKLAGDDGMSLRHFPRHAIRLAQTPQGFRFDAILSAHEKARLGGARCADDAELYDLFAGPVAWVPGEPSNRKITWPHDIEEYAPGARGEEIAPGARGVDA